MVKFCGQEKCVIDANGRIKLPPRFLRDFRTYGDEIVLHCLPEKALAVYPVSVWTQMRQGEPRPEQKAAGSIVFRRQLRRFGALSQGDILSNQGRITVPVLFRPILGLAPGAELVIVGCEIGIEAWAASRWDQEFQLLGDHEQQKGDAEMASDLIGDK